MKPYSRSLLLLTCLAPALAASQDLAPSPLPPQDPDLVAHLVLQDEGSGLSPRSYGVDGRFAGDLNGDGLADIVLPGAVDSVLHLVFGDSALDPAAQERRDGQGDAVLQLPSGCRDGDDRIRWAALGDIDGDGFDDLGVACVGWEGTIGPDAYAGQAAIYLGRASWPSTVPAPDASLLGDPVVAEGNPPTVTSGTRPGADIAAFGDLDGDGKADFGVSGFDLVNPLRPTAWILLGRAAADSYTRVDEAEWRLRGAPGTECISPLYLAGLGDPDGDSIPDLAAGCLAQTGASAVNTSYSVWLGADLVTRPAGDLDFSTRSFRFDPGQLVPTPSPMTALGDLDGDGYDEFVVVSWVDGLASVAVRVVAGHGGDWVDFETFDTWWLTQGEIDPYTAWVPPGLYDSPDGAQVGPAGDRDGDGRGDLWVRVGLDSPVVGLLTSPSPSTWAELGVPPFVSTFGPPGGVTIPNEERFGLGGAADANGDGVPDLLITSGYGGGDCAAAVCGGAYLILCVDGDGDGVGTCDGDCDDADENVLPGALEQCDAIDHDCDGNDGSVDGDGDGLLVCDGDCDDTDPTRYPGAEEACDATEDLNCDGLAPGDDADGDGSLNCEDCQPWLAAMAPGNEEVCDGLDSDCDGELPRVEQDVDGDGLPGCALPGLPADCDDLNPLVRPLRFEDCDNGVDDDCDGVIDASSDADGDGVATCQGDCDDGDADVFPGHTELCDGKDNNCNGVVDDARDDDGDGASLCDGDCDDRNPLRFPGNVGQCDGELDADCSGGSDLLDADGDGYSACSGDCAEGDPGISPSVPDYCDGVDNDCDGVVDGPFDVDGDGWATCLGDCRDEAPLHFPQVVEPLCTDSFDGDCDGLLDAADPDCAVEEPPPEVSPRPYGISCAGSVLPSAPSGFALLLLAGLLLLRRRSRRPDPRAAPSALLPSLLLLSLLAPTPASAAKKERTLLVYLSPQPDLAAMQEAKGYLPKLEASEILHDTELLSSARGLVAPGAASRKRCEGTAPSLGTAATATLDALIELDHRKAVLTASKAIDSLACADRAVPARLLPDLFYYRGIARFALRDLDGTDADFAQVIAFAPEYRADPNFDPLANGRLDAQRKARPEPVVLATYAPPGLRMRIDGQDREPLAGPMELWPGLHIAQVEVARATETLVFEVAGRDVVVLRADDRVRALRDAAINPGARAYAAHTLRDAATTAEVDLCALVDLEVVNEPLRYLYRASSDGFSFEGDTSASAEAGRGPKANSGRASSRSEDAGESEANPGLTVRSSSEPRSAVRTQPVPRAAGARPSAEGPGFRLRVSAGFSLTRPFPYLQIPIDIGIRLVQGLHLDLQFAFANPGPSEAGPIWLPTGALGASYRIPLPVAQPRFGAAFQIGVDDSKGRVAPLPGWYGLAGLDVLVPDTPVLVGFDLRAGMLGAPFFLGVSAGLGVAF